MSQDLFPDPDPDPDPDDAGPEQGLYISLPAGQLTLSGFSQGGASDTMAPGALLATVVDAVAGPDGPGLAGCSEDQLLGIISAVWRQQSRDAWTLMAAIGEFACRAGTGVEGEFAADELASELHMSQQGAAGQMDFATEVPRRLPKTFAALGAGLIHPVHLRIIEEETRYLSAADAAKADAVLAGSAPGQTYGELRYAARKLVLTLDPDIARKRKDAARREAYVRRFQEESGNGGMVARELPTDEVLASWQHVEQRALDLRAAGVPGTLQELRVRAYLDLLQERDTRTLPVPAAPGEAAPGQPAPDQPASGQPASDQPASGQPASGQPASDQPPSGSDPSGPPGPGPGPGGAGRPRTWRRGRPRTWRRGRPRTWRRGRTRPRSRRSWSRATSRLRPCSWPEPGRPGHHHHPPDHLARPLRYPRRSRRVRHPGRRRRPRPGRRRSPPPPHPLVRHRPEPRRHRRRPRLPPRPPPPARHRTPRYQTTRHRTPGRRPTGYQAPGHQATEHRATGNPQHPADPHHPRSLRPRPRPGRLPPQPRPPAPDPRPQRHLHRARLRPSRGPMRPGPHHRLGQGRPDLRMQPGSAVPAPPSRQTSPRLAPRATRTRRPEMADPGWTDLRHHPHRVHDLTRHREAPRLEPRRGRSAGRPSSRNIPISPPPP